MSPDGPISLVEFDRMAVDRLSGVGPKKLSSLKSMGLTSLYDLLTHYPRRYVDRSKERRISDLRIGEEALVLGRVRSVSQRRTQNRRTIVTADVRDDSGTIRCTFFNQPWREKQLSGAPGDGGSSVEVALFGKVEDFRGQRQMTNPVVDLLGNRTGRIVPIYPQSEKVRLTTWEIAGWVEQVIRRSEARGIEDPVPAEVLADLGLVDRVTAITGIHLPPTMAAMVRARERLVFDEVFRIQLSLVRSKREIERSSTGIAHSVATPDGLAARFLAGLPFPLTSAQERAIADIEGDLASVVPMHRLLQGDVGSGKTVVAVAALLRGIEGGYQGAFMAPTEVLAEQHYSSISRMLDGVTLEGREHNLFGDSVEMALLTNRTPAAARRRIAAGLVDGSIDLLVGTHALLEESVVFGGLGVVVIDEQHRFGVEQRAALRRTNPDQTVPDVLVMTATPIPRTAAMTVYGDLDQTEIREMPIGRSPIITTAARTDQQVDDTWRFVRSEVEAGNRGFVVCPLIDESDKLEAASAEATFEQLSGGELAGLRLGLLHGRMASADKADVMDRFRTGALDVLVATTVIEVGVDVPEATVMVILDADRFGIAQLHQLRGRVGRGSAQGHCVLVAGADLTDDAERRIQALVASTDGFALAEVDLDLRGEGTVMGERQKGRNDLKLASLKRDVDAIVAARAVAEQLVGDGDGLDRYPSLETELGLLEPEDEEFLLKS